jgi:hypothetical protein
VEFLKEIKKEKGYEDHGIDILIDENISKMHSLAHDIGRHSRRAKGENGRRMGCLQLDLEKDQQSDD